MFWVVHLGFVVEDKKYQVIVVEWVMIVTVKKVVFVAFVVVVSTEFQKL